MNELILMITIWFADAAPGIEYIQMPTEYYSLEECDSEGAAMLAESNAKGFRMAGYMCADAQTVQSVIVEATGTRL
jgi:hypothetical protein